MGARALKANFTINILGALVPLAVSLVTVPIYIRHIGDARYGVLSIVWVLLGYLGFLDFGLSRAAVNALARLRDAPQAERAKVLVTTMALNLALGLLGSLILAVLGSYLLQHVLNIPDDLKPEIARAFPWVVALFPMALVAGVGIGTLESRERFLLANCLQVGGTAAGQIVPVLLAALVSPSLALIIPAAALARGLMVVTVLVVVWRSEGPLTFRQFDRSQARKLLSYGGWITVSGVISPILVSADQFVIGSALGVAAVALYAIPMNLVTRSQVFPSALARTLFPRMSHAGGEDARRLARRALGSLTYGYGAICAPAIVATPLFFHYWIGPERAAIAAPVAQLLFFGAWVNGLAFVPYELLQSQGRPDVTGKFHAAEVVPFTALLWGATSLFGIMGAAIAWSIRCAVDALCLYVASRMPREDLVRAMGPLLLMLGAGVVSHFIGANLWPALSATVIVGLLALTMALCMDADLRGLARGVSVRLMQRVRKSPVEDGVSSVEPSV